MAREDFRTTGVGGASTFLSRCKCSEECAGLLKGMRWSFGYCVAKGLCYYEFVSFLIGRIYEFQGGIFLGKSYCFFFQKKKSLKSAVT